MKLKNLKSQQKPYQDYIKDRRTYTKQESGQTLQKIHGTKRGKTRNTDQWQKSTTRFLWSTPMKLEKVTGSSVRIITQGRTKQPKVFLKAWNS